jgi:hypothetical protein
MCPRRQSASITGQVYPADVNGDVEHGEGTEGWKGADKSGEAGSEFEEAGEDTEEKMTTEDPAWT